MQAKHAAPGPIIKLYRRFAWMADQPMTKGGGALAGAFLGLVSGLTIFYCYFG